MGDRKRLVIHVGYPKSGTTSMQQNLYSTLQGRGYVGKPKKHGIYFDEETRQNRNIWRIIRRIVGADDLHFREALPELAASLRRRILEADSAVVVMSDEDLMRPSRCLPQTGQLADVSRVPERLRILHEHGLSDVCDLHVLITIRRQTDLIPSYYAQFGGEEVHYGIYGRGFDRFCRFCLEDDLVGYGPVFNFDTMVARFEATLRAPHVHVVAMEALFDPDDERAAATMGRLIGVSPEVVATTLRGSRTRSKRLSGPEGSVMYLARHVPVGARAILWRLADRQFPKNLRHENKTSARLRIRARKFTKRSMPRERFEVDSRVRERLYEAYLSGNRRLDSRRGLNLARYQYC